MMVHIPNVLTPEQVARCRDVMTKADWVDCNDTAGHHSRKVNTTCSCPRNPRPAEELGGMGSRRSNRSPLFMSACCAAGVSASVQSLRRRRHGLRPHVDNAIRSHTATADTHPHRRFGDTVHLGAEDYDGESSRSRTPMAATRSSCPPAT